MRLQWKAHSWLPFQNSELSEREKKHKTVREKGRRVSISECISAHEHPLQLFVPGFWRLSHTQPSEESCCGPGFQCYYQQLSSKWLHSRFITTPVPDKKQQQQKKPAGRYKREWNTCSHQCFLKVSYSSKRSSLALPGQSLFIVTTGVAIN